MFDLQKYGPYLGAAAAGGLGIVAIYKRFWAVQAPAIPPKPERICGRDYPRDKVIVHNIIRGPYAPSLGNMVVKLETYLRIANIPYEEDINPLNMAYGPKKKIPWIEYNGKEIGDSEFIIEFLEKEFKIDLDAKLSKVQKAYARAIQKWVDEFTYWLIVYTRWSTLVKDWYPHVKEQCGNYPPKMIEDMMRKMGYDVGVGRHSAEEIAKMLEDDLTALSDLLGDKKYFMGDKPTRVDCAVFGELAQLRWHTPDSCTGKRLLREKFTNLNDFCLRIKDTFWPDWEECCKNTRG